MLNRKKIVSRRPECDVTKEDLFFFQFFLIKTFIKYISIHVRKVTMHFSNHNFLYFRLHPNMVFVLTTEKLVFLVERVFREGGKYTDLARQSFADRFSDTPVHIAMQFVTLLINFGKQDQWTIPNFVEDQQSCLRTDLNISDGMQQSPRISLLRKLAQQQDIGLGTAHKPFNIVL